MHTISALKRLGFRETFNFYLDDILITNLDHNSLFYISGGGVHPPPRTTESSFAPNGSRRSIILVAIKIFLVKRKF